MQFEKGHKKIGGRKKGTPNKVTSETRDCIAGAINREVNKIPKMLRKLEEDPAAWILAFSRLLPYLLPKMHTITLDDISGKAALSERLSELNESVSLTMEKFKQKILNNAVDEDGDS